MLRSKKAVNSDMFVDRALHDHYLIACCSLVLPFAKFAATGLLQLREEKGDATFSDCFAAFGCLFIFVWVVWW